MSSRIFADNRFAKAGLAASGLWLLVRSYIAHRQINIITVDICARFCTRDEDPMLLAALLVKAGLWLVSNETVNTWVMADFEVLQPSNSERISTYSDIKSALYEGNPSMVYDLPDIRQRSVMQYILDNNISRSDLKSFSKWYGRSNFKRRGYVPTFAELTAFDMADFIEAVAMWRNSNKPKQIVEQEQPKPKTKDKADLSVMGIRKPNV